MGGKEKGGEAWKSYVTVIFKLYQTGYYNENNSKSDIYARDDVINDSSISYEK